MGLFGLSPEQVAQYGVALVALVVMGALIALFMTQTKNNAKNDEARNAMMKQSFDLQVQQTQAIAEIKEGFIAAINSLREGQMQSVLVIKGLVDGVVQTGNDTVDAIQSTGAKTIRLVEEARTVLIEAVDNTPIVTAGRVGPIVRERVEEAVALSIRHQDANKLETKGYIETAEQNLRVHLNQASGDLASRLDRIQDNLKTMLTIEQYMQILNELSIVKAGISRIEAAQTRPLPPLENTHPVFVSDVAPIGPQSLVEADTAEKNKTATVALDTDATPLVPPPSIGGQQ